MSRRLPLGGQMWKRVSLNFLPFADAATEELPLARLLRLSLFQVSVGMAMALMFGTLNRVMILELGVPASLVAVMVGLPILIAPFRALIGHKSDHHRSAFGWRRVPYIWWGTMALFGGLAIMPFALMVLSGDNGAPVALGRVASALAFILIGVGVQVTQTAGLALATDLAPEPARPRVVALMYVMLLVGTTASSFVFSAALENFSPLRLIQVVQGAGLLSMIFNVVALWKQEARNPHRAHAPEAVSFREAWADFVSTPDARRFLLAIALGTAGFNMQDVLLEPYGGEVLKLSVSQTSLLTAIFAFGSLLAFALAARLLMRGWNPYRLAAYGALIGVPGFCGVIFASMLDSPLLFRLGTIVIGFGGGLFAVSTLAAAMGMDEHRRHGLALGAWGAVQATAAGLAVGLGGVLRDALSAAAESGWFGPTLASPVTGYGLVYQLEILLLLAALVAIGPLARHAADDRPHTQKFGLAEFPS
jgi:BCD family chlorophyll transporter-like MFS transporter